MTYLVDSDVVADYLRGRPGAVEPLNRVVRQGLAISIITFAEIYEGVYYGRDPNRNEMIFLRFVRGVQVVGISRAVARRYALIRGELRRKGRMIPQPDVLIAATAMEHDRVLVTRNIRDFDRIVGLRFHSPSELPM